MILDRLDNAQRYALLHPGFQQAFAYLKQTDFQGMQPGRHDLDGTRLYVMLNQGDGRGRDGVKLEAHRKYIDIQYTVIGAEEIGWQPLAACSQVDTPFDPKADFGLFADRPTAWVAVPPGTFTIFFPEDAHAPMAALVGSPLLKAVIKVAVDWQ
ncbi:MAG: YhcH/YjgK/YiaL family protein [Planctomycetales bacterium]